MAQYVRAVACRCGGKRVGDACDRCGQGWRRESGRKWAHLYNCTRWRKSREVWLANNPMCVECGRNGIARGGNQLDHIIPHNGDLLLFWSADNWQTLCVECHGRKTRRGE